MRSKAHFQKKQACFCDLQVQKGTSTGTFWTSKRDLLWPLKGSFYYSINLSLLDLQKGPFLTSKKDLQLVPFAQPKGTFCDVQKGPFVTSKNDLQRVPFGTPKGNFCDLQKGPSTNWSLLDHQKGPFVTSKKDLKLSLFWTSKRDLL